MLIDFAFQTEIEITSLRSKTVTWKQSYKQRYVTIQKQHVHTYIPEQLSVFSLSARPRPSLYVLRVEKLKPVLVAHENQGIFSGDSYLVLYSALEEFSHLHLWIAQQWSRDEQGACVVLAVHLNTLLGEKPVQH